MEGAECDGLCILGIADQQEIIMLVGLHPGREEAGIALLLNVREPERATHSGYARSRVVRPAFVEILGAFSVGIARLALREARPLKS